MAVAQALELRGVEKASPRTRAAHEQMRELPFYTNWGYAHPRSIELAHELARLAPGDLNRVFFVSGGSEAVESAWKLARPYHQANGQRRWEAVALKNLEIMQRERIVEHVRDNAEAFRSTLAQLLELPIVGDLRGTGFFYALELVKDKETRAGFEEHECEELLRG